MGDEVTDMHIDSAYIPSPGSCLTLETSSSQNFLKGAPWT